MDSDTPPEQVPHIENLRQHFIRSYHLSSAFLLERRIWDSPLSLVRLRSIAICTSDFSLDEHKSVFGILAAFSSHLLLLNVNTTTGKSSFFLRSPMR
jgi:hypothetical protein